MLLNPVFSIVFLLTYVILIQATIVLPIGEDAMNNPDLSAKTTNKTCPEYFRNNPQVPCYQLLEETCYCFSTQLFLMTWIDAKGYCRLSNYTLISLETEAEDVLIHQHISNTEVLQQPWYWTSGAYSENTWRWSTGSFPGEPFTYSNWSSTRPQYNLGGYCTEINYSIFQGGWADFSCDFTNFFICEGNATVVSIDP